MEQPLNPMLHALLKRRFGKVKITNPGAAFRGHIGHDWASGRDVLKVDMRGEGYAVCCPHCGDTRFRLIVNHRWGVRDSRGFRNLWLVKCYNDTDCFNTDKTRRGELLEELEAPGWQRLENARVMPASEDRDLGEVVFPGPVTRLDELPPGHPAWLYLAGRGFDPVRLGRAYGVSWCQESRYTLARRRLIVPFYEEGELVYWQARYPGELDWKDKTNPPKYWNLARPRGAIVYNIDAARNYATGVVCEGVSDVWAVGPMAVALLNNRLLPAQRRKLQAAFAGRPLVLLLDPDHAGEAGEAVGEVDLLRQAAGPGRFAIVRLPEGRDAGSLSRAVVRQYVEEGAAEQGVTVSWKRLE